MVKLDVSILNILNNGFFLIIQHMHEHNNCFNRNLTKLVTLLTKCFFQYLNPTSYLNRYKLSDQVWWCNVKLSYPKNYICKFIQVISWHRKLFHFQLPFWIWKVWKGREQITKIWISRERKELFRWNKKHFS